MKQSPIDWNIKKEEIKNTPIKRDFLIANCNKCGASVKVRGAKNVYICGACKNLFRITKIETVYEEIIPAVSMDEEKVETIAVEETATEIAVAEVPAEEKVVEETPVVETVVEAAVEEPVAEAVVEEKPKKKTTRKKAAVKEAEAEAATEEKPKKKTTRKKATPKKTEPVAEETPVVETVMEEVKEEPVFAPAPKKEKYRAMPEWIPTIDEAEEEGWEEEEERPSELPVWQEEEEEEGWDEEK